MRLTDGEVLALAVLVCILLFIVFWALGDMGRLGGMG